jgi:hypothetical protein
MSIFSTVTEEGVSRMTTMMREFESKLEPINQYLMKDMPGDENGQKIVQKGLLLFRQNLVRNVKVKDDLVLAEVQDVTTVKVKIDLNFPLLSKCSCPGMPWCRHRMATFFSLYQRVNRVSNWVQDWRRLKNLDDHSSESNDLQELLEKHNKTGALKKASDLLKTKKDRGNSPQEWWDFLQQLFEEWDKDYFYRQSNLLDLHIQNFYRRLMKEAPFEREWKPLYQIFAAFFLLVEIDRLLLSLQGTLNKEQQGAYELLVDEIYDGVKQLSVHALPFSFDPYVDFLKNKTNDLSASEENSTYVKAAMYRFLWFYLFKKKTWRQEEIKRLEEETQDDLFQHVALLHQYIMLDQLEHAQPIIKAHGEELISYSDFWIEQLFSTKRYDTGKWLLQQLLPHLKRYLGKQSEYEQSLFNRWFLRIIPLHWMIEHEGRLLKEILLALLPFSFYTFNEMLLDSKSYAEWVELQQFIGYDLRDLDGLGLKEVTKTAPEYTLPLYHVGIDHYLSQKNRESYKHAVKYLKKLRTIYRKLKKQERWETYFNHILEKTKRLRAFHEECRKGKLIDA